MKNKIIIFFIISSVAFSMNKDLKMKMVLDKSNQNRITIDIVPENYKDLEDLESNKLIKELEKYENIKLEEKSKSEVTNKKDIKINNFKNKKEYSDGQK